MPQKNPPQADFDSWWNSRHFYTSHPWYQSFKKLHWMGADLNYIYMLCRILALFRDIFSNMVEIRKKYSERSSQWRKQFRGLFISHPSGSLTLTLPAQIYTNQVIRFTLESLKRRELINSSTDGLIPEEELKWIKQNAIEPLAKAPSLIKDEWVKALNDIGKVNPDISQSTGLEGVPTEQGQKEKEAFRFIIETFWPRVFGEKGSWKRDDMGSFFLLAVTEHLRKTTRKRKPHFGLAYGLMKTCQGKRPTSSRTAQVTAAVRVKKLKSQLEWEPIEQKLLLLAQQ